MITKSAILGVLLVGLIIGAYLYLTADPGPDEEITVVWEVKSVEEGGYTQFATPYYIVNAEMTVTSNVSKTIHIDSLPKLVQEYEGYVTEFTSYYTTEWPSGSKLRFIDLTYSYASGVGLLQGDYHFELSDSMKRAGNYTLIVR